ncbi:hypothetical protein GKZ89_01380 [Bacillus mangrovi]|uniref:Uncharacterized protein n=1 Tax=Metabacillus mangrovi TaxID=1491830 RepID=A0A7X2S287_9BACI|nr:hypothetical protein [Metabacillus mangrovi]MTH52042.1 hypothetical protein [Metabacillus mangrovi]
MEKKGSGLYDRQLRIKALLNSMAASKSAGKAGGVHTNMESLMTLLKEKAEMGNPVLEKEHSGNVAPLNLTEPVQDEVPVNLDGMKQETFSAVKEMPNASQLFWDAINRRFAGIVETPVQDKGVLAGLIGTGPFAANPEIWSRLETALPDTYTLPNPKTVEALKNIVQSGE